MSAPSDNHPEPPEGLAGEALCEWNRIVSELESSNRLEKIDRAIIGVYVDVWSAHSKAARNVRNKGPTWTAPNGWVLPTPSYNVMMKTAQQLRALLKEMGLTPSSRPKSKPPADEELDV